MKEEYDDSERFGFELSDFLSSNCFNGFDDFAKTGFYQVYSDVFKKIYD